MMWRVRAMGLLLVVLVTACGADDGNGPSDGDEVNGVAYTASVNEIQNLSTKLFSVMVSMKNTTSATVTRRYPVGCAVQLRFYRPTDQRLMYDEAKRPCAPADSLTATIPAGATITLTSGVRFPNTLTDSIPAGTYRVSAIVNTEPRGILEVVAGTYYLPLCVPSGMGTVCS